MFPCLDFSHTIDLDFITSELYNSIETLSGLSIARRTQSPAGGPVLQRQLQLQLLDFRQQIAKLEHDVERCRDALESPPAEAGLDRGTTARCAVASQAGSYTKYKNMT